MRSLIALSSACSIAILALIPLTTHAQQIFITSDATINSDVSGNDIFVGKDNLTSFATLPGTITLTIGNNANLTSYGTIAPDRNFYYGLTVFGSHHIDFTGGSMDSGNSYDSSTINISGGTIYGGVSSYNGSAINIGAGVVGYTSSSDVSTINISGGTIYGTASYSNSTINISDGTVNYSATSNETSTINISGGTVNNGASSFDNSTINIVSGIINNGAGGYGYSTVNVAGGEIDYAYCYDSCLFNVSGGIVNGSATSYGSSAINISGGSITGDISLFDTSQLTVSGNGLSVVSGNAYGYYDGVNHIVRDYSITGNLSDGTAFSKTITAAGNTADLSATSVQLHGSLFDVAPDLYVTSDGAANGVYNNVTVGKDSTGTISTSPTVLLTKGADATSVNAYNNSNVTLNDGLIHGSLLAYDAGAINVRGGTVSLSANSYNNSTINISGGTVGDSTSTDNSTITVSGGTVAGSIYSFDASKIKISGGTVDGGISSFGGSTVNISGGAIYSGTSSDNSTINVSGGTVSGYVASFDTSTVTISGGTVNSAESFGSSTTSIAGGVVYFAASYDPSTLNISGGTVGGIDSDLTDYQYIGIYELGGTFNLYGSGFTLRDSFTGRAFGFNGIFSTLTGTLLDGSALNTTFFLADGVTFKGGSGGGSEDDPILPSDPGQSGVFTFSGVPTLAWIDPPLVGSYQFTMIDGHLFTDILAFPSGIGDADGLFTVSVDGKVLGQFSAAMGVDFAAFGYADGVSSFQISGIDPGVDGSDSQAFPIRLAFNSLFASFTMTPGSPVQAAAPEPASLALLLSLTPLLVRRLRTRR